MATSSVTTGVFAPLDWAERERVIRRFEASWRQGARPAIEDFLPEGLACCTELLIELVHADLEFRIKSGSPVPVEDYLRRFPVLQAHQHALPELILAECQHRRRHGFPAEIEDYVNRFPGHKPQVLSVLSRVPIPAAEPAEAAQVASEALRSPKVLGLPSRYQIHSLAGAGTFGLVYRAFDTELNRDVAIKVPRPGRMPIRGDIERFLREARSAGGLRHPHIVRIYDACQEGGACYIVSEFVEGETLDEKFRTARPTFREAATLVAVVAGALHHAHERGVIHRDLKPSNILIDADGQPRVSDFGLAKHDAAEGTLTQEGDLIGTPAYMSPELASGRGHQVDGRSDVYSLGVVLYQLVTGELPFRGSPRILLYQVSHNEPQPPRRLNDRIPRDLETICLKAMAKEPERRYATAAEFAADLNRFLRSEPIQARPTGVWEHLLIRARRRPAIAFLICLVVLVGTIGACGILWQWRQASLAQRLERKAYEKLKVTLYYRLIALAEREIDARNIRRADELLEECAPELREWEWHYLKRRRFAPPTELKGHRGFVYALAFSPDATQLASGGEDLGIRVWDLATATVRRTLTGHMDPVHSLSYSPNGDRLASAGGHTVRIHNAQSGQEELVFDKHSSLVWSAAFSPDGHWLASAGDDLVVRIWSARDGEELQVLRGHTGRINGVAISPDGRLIASCSWDGTIRLWDVSSGRQIHELSTTPRAGFEAISFSSDGRWLATAGTGTSPVQVWDVRSGTLARTFEGHTGAAYGASFLPRGNRLVSAAGDRSVKLWDIATGDEVVTLRGHRTDFVRSIAVSHDGRLIASGDREGGLLLWDGTPLDLSQTAKNCLILHTSAHPVPDMAFTPDGKALAAASGDAVQIWEMPSGVEQRPLRGHSWNVLGVDFSADGKRLVTASQDKTAKIWNRRTGRELLTLQGHTAALTDAAFSPDGTRVATSSLDYTVRIWDASTGRELETFRAHGESWVRALTFSPDGDRLATAGGDCVRVWQLSPRRELLTLTGHSRDVWAVAFSPDGKRVCSAGRDQSVRIWDATTGQQLQHLEGHTRLVLDVAFSPNGRWLASGSRDLSVKLWDTKRILESLTLRGHVAPVNSLAFSPDGARLASGSADATVRVWTLPAPLGRGPEKMAAVAGTSSVSIRTP